MLTACSKKEASGAGWLVSSSCLPGHSIFPKLFIPTPKRAEILELSYYAPSVPISSLNLKKKSNYFLQMLINICVIKPNAIVGTTAIHDNSSPPSSSSLRQLEGKNSWTLRGSHSQLGSLGGTIPFRKLLKIGTFQNRSKDRHKLLNVFLWRWIHRLLQTTWPHIGLYETTLFPVRMVLRLIRWWEADCKTIIYFWYNLIKGEGLCAVSANLAVYT